MKLKKLCVCLFIFITVFLTSCSFFTTEYDSKTQNAEATLVSKSETNLLGTVITLSTYGDVNPEIFEETFAIIADIDARMSTNLPDSEISKINRNSGYDFSPVSDDLRELIEFSLKFSEASGGAFDITMGAVTELWKSDGQFRILPEDKEIAHNLSLVDYKQIFLSENGVKLGQPGMKLDLGAIAKGYACDVAREYLQARGVTSAILDFGGNIYVYGQKPDGSKWNVGVRTPFIDEKEVACIVSVQDATVVTSGGYDRYFEKDGIIYHHLLDPKTGYPAQSGILSVTVVDTNSARADALTTACFVLGLEKGLALLESMPESEGIFIMEDHSIHLTPGLLNNVQLIDSRFHMAT